MTQRPAGLVEIGDFVGDEKVSGWFIDGRGRVNLEYGGRWNRHRASELLEVTRTNVRKFLDLNVGHIPHTVWRDSVRMDELSAMEGKYGWLLHVPDDADDDEDRWLEMLPVIKYARSLDCDYVLFDSDGPIDENLTFFLRDSWYTCDECALEIYEDDHTLHDDSCSQRNILAKGK